MGKGKWPGKCCVLGGLSIANNAVQVCALVKGEEVLADASEREWCIERRAM